MFFLSCKKQIYVDKNKAQEQKTTLVERSKILSRSLEKIKNIKYSEYMEDIYSSYIRKDTILWIEGAENMKSKAKTVYFNKSFYDNNNIRNNKYYSLLINKNNNIELVFFEHSKGKGGERKSMINDTIFLEDKKIYFWKKKEITNKELLAKEREILAIKQEIDSILNK